jgi:hypothetical protein
VAVCGLAIVIGRGARPATCAWARGEPSGVSGSDNILHRRGADLCRLKLAGLPRHPLCRALDDSPDHPLLLRDREHDHRRRIYAIGGNLKAARLSGINADRLTFLTFVNMGVLAALAGMVVTARLNSATPKAGTGFELDVIAAVFIGGASMSGGSGRVVGAVIGALIMGVMNNGMSMLGIGIDYQQVIKGLVLLAAVIFDVYNKSK